MTNTCATCKHVRVERMSASDRVFYPYYSRFAKNIVYPKLEDSEQDIKFDIFYCNHPDRFYDDPVSGEKLSKGNLCVDLRGKNSEFCEFLGNMWETKK